MKRCKELARNAMFLAALLTMLPGCGSPTYNSGDRVLVSKFAYDAGLGEPEQFDVVVFKYPKGPVENGVPKNYIKRLLGLPGQILAIFFGQIFVFQPGPDEPPPYTDANDQVDPTTLWEYKYMHTNDTKSRDLFEQPGKFKILQKSPEVMMALRRIVYDNDFPAKDLIGKLPPRWNPKDTGWTADQTNGFSHAGTVKDIDWLRYQHITRPVHLPAHQPWNPAERKPELINDFMDYNAGLKGDHDSVDYLGANWVGDLMFECRLNVRKAEGEFWLELSKGVNRFQARFNLTSGKCTLFKVETDGDKETKKVELASAETRVKSPGEFHIQLANFDSRLTVWVNHELPFGDGKDYPPPEIRGKGENLLDADELLARRGPRKNDLQPASIGSSAAQINVHQLRLWRDTYYTLGPSADRFPAPDQWSDPTAWKDLRDQKVLTMYVQPGHYLCLGDNSPASSDSREWGVVPKRLLLGRAMLVYFPFNRAGPIR